MKRDLAGAVLIATIMIKAASAWAACRSETYTVGGKTIICTRCCDQRWNCTVKCTQKT